MTEGDCYQANGNKIAEIFMEYSKDQNVLDCYKLVHGIVIGAKGSKVEGQEMGHCWIEVNGDVIVDCSNGKEISGRLSAIEYRIKRETCKYYTPKEAATMLSTHEHYGPWD